MSECAEHQPHLYAFADGELAGDDLTRVSEHVRRCPACARIVSDQRHLRQMLAHSLSNDPVPTSLLKRLEFERPWTARVGAPSPARRAARWAGIAAVVLAAAGIGYFIWPRGVEGPRNPPAAPAVVLVVDQAFARHRTCGKTPAAEQPAQDLPQSVDELRANAPELFDDRLLALAPDMSASGFGFESCHRCGLHPDQIGLHIVYRRARDGVGLSLWSIPHVDLAVNAACCDRGPSTVFRNARMEEGMVYNLVAWHCPAGCTTYFACAALSRDELERLLEPQIVAGRSKPKD